MTYQAYGTPPGGPVTFRFGDVYGRSFSIFFSNILPYSVIAAIFLAPGLYFQTQLTGLVGRNPTVEMFQTADYWLVFAGALLVPMLGQMLSQLVIYSFSFQAMRGRPLDVAGALSRVLGRLLPMIGTMLFYYVVVFVGTLLLFVPGIMLAIMLVAMLPVCLIERRGPIAAFERSRELSKGSRWLIFATFLVFGVVGGIANLVIQQIATVAAGPTMAILASYPFVVVYTAFGAVLTISVYQELLLVKEGPAADRFAAVFD